MNAGRARLLHAVGYGVVLCLLAMFARQVPWHVVLLAARAADPSWLVAAAVLNLVSLAAKGVRWWVFLRPVGVRSLSLVLRATFAGASLNNLVVAQGGEAARVLLVARSAAVSSARVLAALAIERALDALSFVIILVAAAWLLPLPSAITQWRATMSVALATTVLATVGIVVYRRAGADDRARRSTAPSPPGTYVARFRDALSHTVSAVSFAAGVTLSAVAWLLQIATYHLVARAAHTPLPLAGSIAALLAVGVSFLVRATPGNVGVFQVVYALAVAPFGVARPDAIAVAVLIQLAQVGPTLLAGMLVSAASTVQRDGGPARETSRRPTSVRDEP